VLRNFDLLEYQWGETDWRGDLLTPHERVENGTYRVTDRPGFGVELDDKVVAAHRL